MRDTTSSPRTPSSIPDSHRLSSGLSTFNIASSHLDVTVERTFSLRLIVLPGRISPGKPKVTDLELAVSVDEEVPGLEVSVQDACRVDVLSSIIKW